MVANVRAQKELTMNATRQAGSQAVMLAVFTLGLFLTSQAQAGTYITYVTGEASGDTIFRVTFDPAVAGSATVTPVLTDTIRLDGIDFVGGSLAEVAVGAQTAGTDGAITHYNLSTLIKLAS